MSQVKLEMIWQHDVVLPYILNDLKKQIETITTVHRIVLFGSRAKKNIKDWHTLEGKDWDIIVVADCPIINTHIWTKNKNYHIDLRVINKARADTMFSHLNNNSLELYPNNNLQVLLE